MTVDAVREQVTAFDVAREGLLDRALAEGQTFAVGHDFGGVA